MNAVTTDLSADLYADLDAASTSSSLRHSGLPQPTTPNRGASYRPDRPSSNSTTTTWTTCPSTPTIATRTWPWGRSTRPCHSRRIAMGTVAKSTPVSRRTVLTSGSATSPPPRRSDEPPDPLAPAAARRHTNRRPYDKTPCRWGWRRSSSTRQRDGDAAGYGSTSRQGLSSVMEGPPVRKRSASLEPGADRRAPDGMTPEGLALPRVDWLALPAAFRLGRLPRRWHGLFLA